MSTDEKTYEGQCYCGAVKIVVTGDPAGAGYDHCVPCRSWSAGRQCIHAVAAAGGPGDPG
jgi:hypothetical protein